MRFGGPIFERCADPEAWVQANKRLGYTAAYWPLDDKASDDVCRAYAAAAKAGDLIIAEVGAWANSIDPDDAKRKAAIKMNIERLALADRVGARCCVNIAGSRGTQWDGPHADNFTRATFDMIVETVRGIIDAVRPTRSFYTLECMGWVPPYTTDNYVDLVRAIDRKAFAVHFDPVNMIWSPERFYRTGEIIREFVAKLGPLMRCCHAKDVRLLGELTVHMPEVRAGLGGLDYRTLLTELARLDPDTPLMLEHLPNEQEYLLAAAHIRSVAKDVGVSI